MGTQGNKTRRWYLQNWLMELDPLIRTRKPPSSNHCIVLSLQVQQAFNNISTAGLKPNRQQLQCVPTKENTHWPSGASPTMERGRRPSDYPSRYEQRHVHWPHLISSYTDGVSRSHHHTTQANHTQHAQPRKQTNWWDIPCAQPHPEYNFRVLGIWRVHPEQSQSSLDWHTSRSNGMVHPIRCGTIKSKTTQMWGPKNHSQIQSCTGERAHQPEPTALNANIRRTGYRTPINKSPTIQPRKHQ